MAKIRPQVLLLFGVLWLTEPAFLYAQNQSAPTNAPSPASVPITNQPPQSISSDKDIISLRQSSLTSLRQKAEAGDAEAQGMLGGRYYLGEGVGKDFSQAVIWFRKSAEQGNAPGQCSLGICYANGKGVPQDYTQAVKWYRLSAEQGEGGAQSFLGFCYLNGDGVAEDDKEAVKWLRKAYEQKYLKFDFAPVIEKAASGNVFGQLMLASFYATGLDNLEKNLVQAAKWCRKAAEQGNAEAQFCLACDYYNGDGVEKDQAEAVKWYLVSAEQGCPDAENNLGIAYSLGNGVIKDEVEGYAWSLLAAAGGETKARDAIESQLERPLQLAGEQRAKELQVKIAQNQAKNPSSQSPPKAPQLSGSGSGLAISANYVLTTAHVINGAKQIIVSQGESKGLAAQVLACDLANDVAVLKVDGNLQFTSPVTADVRIGEKVFTLGFPRIQMQGLTPKYTSGDISSLSGIQDDPRMLQISVPIQPGNSGGPLLDERGALIGIVVSQLDAAKAFQLTNSLPQDVNYAVKSDYFIPLLKANGIKVDSSPAGLPPQDKLVDQISHSVVLILILK